MIKYVIKDIELGVYLCDKPVLCWVERIELASKFKSGSAADNQRKGAYKKFIGDRANFVVTDMYTTDEKNSIKEIDSEEADTIYTNIENVVSAMSDVAPNIEVLIAYLNSELSTCDKMQEDLLHKIEFDSVVGVAGLRLVKQLKDVRTKRREIKDKLVLVSTLQRSNFANVVTTFNKCKDMMEDRHYNPRALPELF